MSEVGISRGCRPICLAENSPQESRTRGRLPQILVDSIDGNPHPPQTANNPDGTMLGRYENDDRH
jgi:hypothetical protein